VQYRRHGKAYSKNIPEVYRGVFLIAWLIGEIFTIAYLILTNPTAILLLNYGVNLIVLLIILRYKIWEGVKND